MTITGAGGGLGERGVGAGVAVVATGAGGGVPGFFSGFDWTLMTSGVCWIRRVEPASLKAVCSPTATVALAVVGVAIGAGASGAATGMVSSESVEECKFAGAEDIGAETGFESSSSVDASGILSTDSTGGSGVDVGKGWGALSGVDLGACSAEALLSESDTAGVGAGETSGVFAKVCFISVSEIASVCTVGAVGAAGGFVLSRGVSALPAVASVSCRSLITSRSFPLFLSALPVLPAPESTSSWAKLSMLSRILSNNAPSSSSPATFSLLSSLGGVKLWGVLELMPFMVKWLSGFETWN